jgi:hypothetical protein
MLIQLPDGPRCLSRRSTANQGSLLRESHDADMAAQTFSPGLPKICRRPVPARSFKMERCCYDCPKALVKTTEDVPSYLWLATGSLSVLKICRRSRCWYGCPKILAMSPEHLPSNQDANISAKSDSLCIPNTCRRV